MRRVLSGPSVVVGVVLAVGTLTTPTAAATDYSRYVALGDSYVSGAPIPNTVNLPCGRSDHNYPSLVADTIKPGSFTDISCAGATTLDMTAPQPGTGNPPQLDALTPDTTLVTVSIGGNDVPFGEVVWTCGLKDLAVPLGSPCKNHYQRSGTDELDAKVQAVAPKIGAVLDGIRQRSPRARIVVVGYPTVMPDAGDGCWPVVPISAGDVPWLRDKVKLMNRLMAEQAAAHHALFVDTYTSSIGHDMCQAPGVKWIEGVVPTSPAAPLHPNGLGATNQARQTLTALGAGLLATPATAAAAMDGSPPGANNWSCLPPANHPNPVVLVHGASLNKTVGWITLSPLLASRGYCVFSLTYGVPTGTPFPLDQIGGRNRMEDSAAELGRFIDRVLAATHATKVDIVGHSEGSLMPNYYAKYLDGAARIDHYVAMTPLWRGSTVYGVDKLVTLGRQFGLGPLIDGPADLVFASAPQFLAGSEFIQKMNQGGVAVPGITYTNIATRLDEAVVPYTNGFMDAPNATNVVVQDLCPLDVSEHGLLAYDPVNAQVVLNALDPAHVTAVHC